MKIRLSMDGPGDRIAGAAARARIKTRIEEHVRRRLAERAADDGDNRRARRNNDRRET